MAELMRIQKYCSDCGVLSRRAAEAEILAGRVLINGQPAEIGQKIDPCLDVVEYRGKRILPSSDGEKHYLMLHKPRGYVCTLHDEKGRKNVAELTSGIGTRVYPVGRLDMDSEGLLLLTDDGDFASLLTHPRHEIPKIYEVTCASEPTAEQLKMLRAPMDLDGYRLLPVLIRLLAPDKLEWTLWEGRNRQIRRMCEVAGLKITRLRRVAIGSLTLGSLPLGKWRPLTDAEIAYLRTPHQKPKKEI